MLVEKGADGGEFTVVERRLAGYLLRKDYSPPTPLSQFEG